MTLQRARRIGQVVAPMILASECGNVVHRKHPQEYGPSVESRAAALELMLRQASLLPAGEEMRSLAGALVAKHGLSFYDAEYLAAAISQEATLITEDGRLRTVASHVIGSTRALDWDAARRSLPSTAA